MFVLNEILVFTPGRGQEGLDRLSWIHSLMAPNPGFQQAIVAKYLGDTSRHTIMRFWDDEAALQKFRETPDGNYGRNRPEGIYYNERVVSPWNSFGEVNGDASGDFLIKVQREVPEDAWGKFMEQQKGIRDLAAKKGGLVWARQLRAKDQSVALTVARFRGRADVERIIESPEYGALMKEIPEGVNLVRTECFEIVSDVRPR